MPHDHRLPPPRGPRAQVGPLLTGRGVWAFACLHYLPMRAEQGYAQKKSDVCVCKQLFWKLKMGILQTTRKVRFNLRGCGIDKIAGSRYIPHLWRRQRWHQTPAILALQCWSAQARFLAARLHQQCRFTRRKHQGSALTHSGRETLLCGSKTLSLSWTPGSIFKVPNPLLCLVCAVGFQYSPPGHPVHPCPSLSRNTSPPGQPLHQQ